MKRVRFLMNALIVLLTLVSLLLFTGCVAPLVDSGMESEFDPSSLPPVSGFVADFQDIVVPVYLEWQRDESMSIKTESYRGGIWVYTGNVDAISLKEFMTRSMRNNQWRLVGEVISDDIMLAFVKPGKTCMMVITERSFNETVLTLYITIDKTDIRRLN